MVAKVKTPEQKRLDKLESLVTKLIKTNTQLVQQTSVTRRQNATLVNKLHVLEQKLNSLSQNYSNRQR